MTTCYTNNLWAAAPLESLGSNEENVQFNGISNFSRHPPSSAVTMCFQKMANATFENGFSTALLVLLFNTWRTNVKLATSLDKLTTYSQEMAQVRFSNKIWLLCIQTMAQAGRRGQLIAPLRKGITLGQNFCFLLFREIFSRTLPKGQYLYASQNYQNLL